MACDGSVMKSLKKSVISLFGSAVVALLVILLIKNGGTAYKLTEKNTVAMGTAVNIKLYGGSGEAAGEAVIAVQRAEKLLSKNLPNSAVSSLNKNGECKNEELARVIEQCQSVYEKSRGLFDITSGSLTELWGIGTDRARVPGEEEIKAALRTVDGSAIKTDGDTVSCRKGQRIDLGAAGKGYACDQVYKHLSQTETAGAVVSVGGSILTYGHCDKAQSLWRIGVRDPFGTVNDIIGYIETGECFLSTSGDYEKVLSVDGKTYHHILSPFTGYPAHSGLKSVTVCSDSGLLSDVLSTACFLLGIEKSLPLLAYYHAQALFIDTEKTVSLTEGLDGCFHMTSDGYTVKKLA